MKSLNDKSVVVYDGQCHFCIEQIERIKKLDTRHEFEYLPRQHPDAEKRFPVLSSSDFDTGMRLIDRQGNAYVGADALHQIARCLPLTAWCAWLYYLPGIKQAAKLIYAWIAANRKRWGRTCDDGACEVHPRP